jgi:transcriptional regulator GlxA family with amidase domain
VPGIRQVVIAVFDGVEILDVTGPASIFSAASRLLRLDDRGARAGYRVRVAAATAGPVRTSTGVHIVADATLAEVADTADTVVVPGAIQLTRTGPTPLDLPDVVRWVERGAARWRRIASVCTGAYVLAEAGLLDGRRATTHWFAAADFAARYPKVTVDQDPIFVRDGPLWTSAGVTAGMDLSLALVAEDHGEEHARTVARWLVMYLRRPGGQSQFSVPLSVPAPRSARIRDLLGWIAEHPDADLAVPALAARAHMSERHLARVFIRETGVTPAVYVEQSRVEAARMWLEHGDDPVEVVAARCGFGSVETLYRTFRRRLGTTPSDYRRRFRLTAAG